MIADTSCPLCKDNFASYQSMIRHVGRKHPTEDISNIQKKFVACSTVGFYLFFWFLSIALVFNSIHEVSVL